MENYIEYIKQLKEKYLTPTNKEEKTCPLCNKTYTEYPALSRRDNKTYICPECGQKEALEDFYKWQEEHK